jgi:hypothetical protein
MEIGGIELSVSDIDWIEAAGRELTRTELAKRVCERLSLRDGKGRPRVVTARIDISRHVKKKRLCLPETEPLPGSRKAKREKARRPIPREVTAERTLKSLGVLSVHLVEGRKDPRYRMWSEALDAHHYLRSGPLCGARLLYVVMSGAELVAAVSFSAAALKVKARDRYIGWSAAARRRNRPLVISQSRFCLTISAKNLASHVQSLLLSRVAGDWEEAHGYRPLLVETYIDTRHFAGTCYKASNWIKIGQTAGRGRQDPAHRMEAGAKDIYVYALDRNWQKPLKIEPVRKLDHERDWAETEWSGVDLGDSRLTKRLIEFGRSRFNRPTTNIPQSCGSQAATKGAYRLLSHPNAELDVLLSEHKEATLARAAERPVVLAIQDTTSLNYTSHSTTEGLGPIASTGAESTKGFEVHSLFLCDPTGIPLGLLDVNAWARDPETYGKKTKRWKLKTEEKESQKWLRGYEAANVAAQRATNAKFVVIGDREADMFDLFRDAVNGKAELLVRAVHGRRLKLPDSEEKAYLWDTVRQDPIVGVMHVLVPRRGSRQERTAVLELRSKEVSIAYPRRISDSRPGVTLWAIAASEVLPEGSDAEPLEWLLLTTLPAKTTAEVEEKVRWYARRWLIEVFHRTLKSGCNIENRQSTSAKSLLAALAIDVVIAWRVMYLVKIGREMPDIPCSIFFEEEEWKALCCFTQKTRTPPEKPPTLREASRMVAQLGGFLGRKSDGDPGAETIWRGLERLSDITVAFTIFLSLSP